MGKMKGVSLVFEQVLLFMIGVVIFAACFTTFSLYQSYFTSGISYNQLNEIRNAVSSEIVSMSSSDFNSTVRMDLPGRVGEKPYFIELRPEGLFVYTMGPQPAESFSPLYGINRSFSLDGRFSSAAGEGLVIYKKENEIIIA